MIMAEKSSMEATCCKLIYTLRSDVFRKDTDVSVTNKILSYLSSIKPHFLYKLLAI